MAIFEFKPNINSLEKRRDIEGLIKALRYEKSTEIQEAAIRTLGNMGEQKAVVPLTEMVMHSSYHIKTKIKAINALENLGAVEPLIDLSTDL